MAWLITRRRSCDVGRSAARPPRPAGPRPSSVIAGGLVSFGEVDRHEASAFRGPTTNLVNGGGFKTSTRFCVAEPGTSASAPLPADQTRRNRRPLALTLQDQMRRWACR